MGADSTIEWTHHTLNPWRGCSKVHAGCTNCYAEKNIGVKMQGITWGEVWQGGQRVVAADSAWEHPPRWARAAAKAGERRRVFCASLADVLEVPEDVPSVRGGDEAHRRVQEARAAMDGARARLWDAIRQTAHVGDDGSGRYVPFTPTLPSASMRIGGLDWLLLTKRPENWRLVPEDVRRLVWLGTSISDQKTADEWVPRLLQAEGFRVRFLSVEPLVGPVDLSTWLRYTPSHGRDSKQGGIGAGGCTCRRTGSGQPGPRLEAGRAAVEPLDAMQRVQTVQAQTRGELLGRVPPGESHDGRRATPCLGAPTGVQALLWGANPRWHDGQPQERQEDGQPPHEFGAGLPIGAGPSRAARLEAWSGGPTRRAKRDGETHGRTGDSGAHLPGAGGEAPGTRCPIHGERASHIEDLPRGAPGISWVIVGGESGPKARPCNVEWVRDIVRQCREAGVPCFVKQLGSRPVGLGGYGDFAEHMDPKGGNMDQWPEDIRVREFPEAHR